jgi:hypothetical protein
MLGGRRRGGREHEVVRLREHFVELRRHLDALDLAGSPSSAVRNDAHSERPGALRNGRADSTEPHQAQGATVETAELQTDTPSLRTLGHPGARELLLERQHHREHPFRDGNCACAARAGQGAISQGLERKIVDAGTEGMDPTYAARHEIAEVGTGPSVGQEHVSLGPGRQRALFGDDDDFDRGKALVQRSQQAGGNVRQDAQRAVGHVGILRT